MRYRITLLPILFLLAGAAPDQDGKGCATTQPAVVAPLVVREHLPATPAEDEKILRVVGEAARPDQVIRLVVPPAIQEQVARRLNLNGNTFKAPFEGVRAEIFGSGKEKVYVGLLGITSLGADVSGWLTRVPIKWKYDIALRKTDNEPLDGGRRVAGYLDLRSSSGNCSIRFEARILIRTNDRNEHEPKSAEVVWTGPEALK